MLIISCSSSEKPDFSWKEWRNDPNGCQGNRLALSENFKNIREELIDRDADFFIENMGKPDRREPYKRNVVYFKYMISGSGDCNNAINKEEKFVQIRFNAIGRSNEVIILD